MCIEHQLCTRQNSSADDTAENESFPKKTHRYQKKHMKRCSISLTVREMKIKTTTWYHLTPVRTAIVKNLQIITAAEGVDNSEHSCAVGGNVN